MDLGLYHQEEQDARNKKIKYFNKILKEGTKEYDKFQNGDL